MSATYTDRPDRRLPQEIIGAENAGVWVGLTSQRTDSTRLGNPSDSRRPVIASPPLRWLWHPMTLRERELHALSACGCGLLRRHLSLPMT